MAWIIDDLAKATFKGVYAIGSVAAATVVGVFQGVAEGAKEGAKEGGVIAPITAILGGAIGGITKGLDKGFKAIEDSYNETKDTDDSNNK